MDGETYADAKAEEKRDELLSMDLDTFARLILLQQSRIRGLLMDEVSERRKAMDKLLGIDVLADIATELKPKRFLDRADALLSEGEKTLIGLEGEERKLVDLREKAQETAQTGVRKPALLAGRAEEGVRGTLRGTCADRGNRTACPLFPCQPVRPSRMAAVYAALVRGDREGAN